MSENTYDVIFVGGGLANSLSAYRLQQLHRHCHFRVLEASDRLGGDHTWSFHDSDLDPGDREWVLPLVSQSWPAQRIAFPLFERTIDCGYHSVRSCDFHRKIANELGDRLSVLTPVNDVSASAVTLASGETLKASLVIDGRGWQAMPNVPLAYQKFLGQTLRLKSPHGLKIPTIMDATCRQIDGFRFFYLLPWDESRLLIEDTRYSEDPRVDRDGYATEIARYAASRGWEVDAVDYEEQGSLAIPLSGELPFSVAGVVRSGVRGGLFHATTGYSFAESVRFANLLAQSTRDGRIFEAENLTRYSIKKWKQGNFFRLLNRMMFYAATPEHRYKILQRFYTLPDGLIARFYSGRLTQWDCVRILAGKPPVPVIEAVKSIFATKGRFHEPVGV